MKKFLVGALILLVASPAFAGISFLTAPGVGEGRIGILGLYATDHNFPVDTLYDSTTLGLRGCYGILSDLDVLLSYTSNSLPNISKYKDLGMDLSLVGSNTLGLGVKYTFLKEGEIPVSVAGILGYQGTHTTVDEPTIYGATSNIAELGLGIVVSRTLKDLIPVPIIPYGCIALKSLVDDEVTADIIFHGSAVALNLGVMVPVMENAAVALELNSQNDAYTYPEGYSTEDYPPNNIVSDLALGFAYVF